MSSIDKHDPKVMNKIQKRRGRKKFILNNDDFNSADSIYATVLNKREQKYLSKVVQMADHPLHSIDAKRSQPLLNGEFKEFQEEWPKSSQKPLANITKLLSQYGLDQCIDSN